MEYGVCSCGAVTVYIEGENFSMPMDKFRELFDFNEEARAKYDPPELINETPWDNCNYCVNHWGIDLCGCGSGEKVGKCNEGFEQCKNSIPMQSIELGYTHVAGGWI